MLLAFSPVPRPASFNSVSSAKLNTVRIGTTKPISPTVSRGEWGRDRADDVGSHQKFQPGRIPRSRLARYLLYESCQSRLLVPWIRENKRRQSYDTDDDARTEQFKD
jgi:hypothetical protein